MIKKFFFVFIIALLSIHFFCFFNNSNTMQKAGIFDTISGWFKSLYEWVKGFAQRGEGPLALFIIAFAESSFFPIPPDVLLVLLCINAPHYSAIFALICSAGSISGGAFGYLIGWKFWELVKKFFFRYIIKKSTFMRVKELYDKNAFWAVFTAAFTPIPYKVFTIAAGVFRIKFLAFMIASSIGRPLRFFLVAGAIMIFGKEIQIIIEKYFELFTIIFVVLLIGGFIIIKKFSRKTISEEGKCK